MKIGRKAEAKAKRLVEFLIGQISADEERFSFWEKALFLLGSLRFTRKVRAFSLTRSIPLVEKVDFFQGVLRNAGLLLPEDAAKGFLSVLILEFFCSAVLS